MSNRLVVVTISLVAGALLYFGLLSLGGVIADPPALFGSTDVRVMDGSMHLDRAGTPVVVGEVINNRRGPIDNVSITVAFYGDGEHIANVSTRPEVSPIPGNTKSPYIVRLRDASVRPDAYEVFVEYEESDRSSYGGLEVSDVRAEQIGQDRVQVAGRIENVGDRTVDPAVFVIFYDETDSVIGIRSGRASPSTLEPGGSGEFLILYNTLGDVPSRAREYGSHEVVVATVE